MNLKAYVTILYIYWTRKSNIYPFFSSIANTQQTAREDIEVLQLPDELPFIVFVLDEKYISVCLGTLFAPKFILTSAQCVLRVMKSMTDRNAAITVSTVGVNTKLSSHHVSSKIHIHPKFEILEPRTNLARHDLAVMEFSNVINYI